jgi:hypothetical protein
MGVEIMSLTISAVTYRLQRGLEGRIGLLGNKRSLHCAAGAAIAC